MIKTFTADKDGYIKFTEAELKKLLDEVYNEGKKDGKIVYWSSPSITYDEYWKYTSPTTTWTVTCHNNTIGSDSITWKSSADNSKADTHITARTTMDTHTGPF